MRQTLGRRWEIDCLRGLAVVLMVLSNLLFDLVYFVGLTWFNSRVLDWFARLVAGSFILIAGVSLTLRQARHDACARSAGNSVRLGGAAHSPGAGGLARVLARGLTLLGLGGVVSVATWFTVGDQLVIFGVLHLIGAGLILAYPFLGRPRASLGAGILVLAAALFTSGVRLDHPWLLWLGLQPRGFYSVDYAPLIPWLGPLLIGVALGEFLYPGGQPRWPFADLSRPWPVRTLSWCGRHSLFIYFAHQPLLLGGIAMVRKW